MKKRMLAAAAALALLASCADATGPAATPAAPLLNGSGTESGHRTELEPDTTSAVAALRGPGAVGGGN